MGGRIRTASAEEFGEHVEGIGMLVLAALVSLQAFFAMAVVYLSFLVVESGRGETQSRVVINDIPLSQRGPRMLRGKSVRRRRPKQS